MNDNTISDINNSNKKIFKKLWTIGDKYLVILDKSIVEKLGIIENSTVFLEQQLTPENIILMRIKKF